MGRGPCHRILLWTLGSVADGLSGSPAPWDTVFSFMCQRIPWAIVRVIGSRELPRIQHLRKLPRRF